MNTRSFIISAVIAGVALGLLGNLPLVNLVNCILCIWVWLGGAGAVLLYRRFQSAGPALTAAQGATLGAAAGLVGAIFGSVVYAVTAAISAPIFEALMRQFQSEGQTPFSSSSTPGNLGMSLILLAVDIVLYPIFGALGGYLAVRLGKKST